MLTKLVFVLFLIEFGQADEMFIFYRGKSLKETSQTFEITTEPIGSKSFRQCVMLCHFTLPCLAAFFEGESSVCRLYSNINGTTTGEEGDFAMVKKEFGVCESLYSFISINLTHYCLHTRINVRQEH